MSDPRWTKPLTQDEMADRLGIACCALDKIIEWTDEDSDKFGDQGLFAKTALDYVYGGGLPISNLPTDNNANPKGLSISELEERNMEDPCNGCESLGSCVCKNCELTTVKDVTNEKT